MKALRFWIVLASLFFFGLSLAQDLRIYFLDVGQGDGILIITPDGKSMVYDAGRAKDKAADLILSYGITRVDLAVASHADADHIGGLEGVAQKLKPRVFLNNGIPATTGVYQRVLQAMTQAGAQGIVATDRTIQLGTSVKIQVLASPANVPADNQNAHSVGVLIQYGAFKAFFGGDSEASTERGWLAKYRSILQDLDVYKSAHHGSKNNDIPEFLTLLYPQDVAIGVGTPNSYGHPTPEALALYDGVGADIWRTDQNGTILVNVKADGSYTIAPQRGNIVTRMARGATGLNPTPTPPVARVIPKQVGTLSLQGQTLYVYEGQLPDPPQGQSNPNLVSTISINGQTLFVYDGPAP